MTTQANETDLPTPWENAEVVCLGWNTHRQIWAEPQPARWEIVDIICEVLGEFRRHFAPIEDEV